MLNWGNDFPLQLLHVFSSKWALPFFAHSKLSVKILFTNLQCNFCTLQIGSKAEKIARKICPRAKLKDHGPGKISRILGCPKAVPNQKQWLFQFCSGPARNMKSGVRKVCLLAGWWARELLLDQEIRTNMGWAAEIQARGAQLPGIPMHHRRTWFPASSSSGADSHFRSKTTIPTSWYMRW